MPSTPRVWAPYMHWGKYRAHPRWDLGGSNLLPCRVDDLPGAREALELSGANDDGYRPLLEAIAARYGTSVDRVSTATGASGANFLALGALVRPGDAVLVERPVYDPLPGAARFLGADVDSFERCYDEGYALDPQRIDDAMTAKTKVIVITNPHNPTGVVAPPATIDAIAGIAEHRGARLLVDEVYLDSVYDAPAPPAATRSDAVISTSSLTKSYGLAGLRCGWAIASPEIIEAMHRVGDVVEAIGSFPSERLAVLAFEQLDALAARARSILRPNLETLSGFVDSQPRLEWVRPGGGTVSFPRVLWTDDTTELVERLVTEHDTAVVPGALFDEPAHVRVSFGGSPEVLGAGLDGIARVLAELPG